MKWKHLPSLAVHVVALTREGSTFFLGLKYDLKAFSVQSIGIINSLSSGMVSFRDNSEMLFKFSAPFSVIIIFETTLLAYTRAYERRLY